MENDLKPHSQLHTQVFLSFFLLFPSSLFFSLADSLSPSLYQGPATITPAIDKMSKFIAE